MNADITTILNTLTQSRNGYGRLRAMTGAFGFVTTKNGVSFRFKGSRKLNYCEITLNARDEYEMKVGKIIKYELKKVEEFGVLDVNMKDAFERRTGLFLSL